MGFKDQFSAPNQDDVDSIVGLFTTWKGLVVVGVVVVALAAGLVLAAL